MESAVFQSHMVQDLSPGPSVSCSSQERWKGPKKDGLDDLSKGFLALLSLSSHRPPPSLSLSLEEEVASGLDLLGVLTSLDHTGGRAPGLCARCARKVHSPQKGGGRACALVALPKC